MYLQRQRNRDKATREKTRRLEVCISTTVDGRIPAQVYRWFLPLFIGFQPSKVVQDFFHQQRSWAMWALTSLADGFWMVTNHKPQDILFAYQSYVYVTPSYRTWPFYRSHLLHGAGAFTTFPPQMTQWCRLILPSIQILGMIYRAKYAVFFSAISNCQRVVGCDWPQSPGLSWSPSLDVFFPRCDRSWFEVDGW